jgi:uncharacterized protein
METPSALSALAGGALLGLASLWLLLVNGRIAGISGILFGMLSASSGERSWRAWFLAGVIAAGVLWQAGPAPAREAIDLAWTAAAGALVGFGSRLGSGCTSGHGICGVARLSPRSMVAVVCFVAAGVASAYIVHHVLGAAW